MGSDNYCKTQLKTLFKSVQRKEDWAQEFVATTWGLRVSKLYRNSEKILSKQCEKEIHNGTVTKWCKSIVSKSNQQKDFHLNGMFRHDHISSSVEADICIPKSCNGKDLKFLMNEMGKSSQYKMRQIECVVYPDLNSFEYFSIFIFALLLLVIIISTIWTLYREKPKKFFTIFSMHTNFMSLIKINKSENVIQCIDGMKVLSAIWISLFHRQNKTKISTDPEVARGYLYHFIANGPLGVDTFFVCSAILLTQSMMRAYDKRTMNIVKLYIGRYLRLIPGVIVIVWLFSTSIPFLLVNQPVIYLDYFITCTKKYWYKPLIFYFNHIHEHFLGYLWYLSTDFQMFVMAPFFVFMLHKFERKGQAFIVLVMGLLVLMKLFLYEKNHANAAGWYTGTQYRLNQYLIGILAGYTIYKSKNHQFNINKFIVFAGWVFSISFLLVAIFILGHMRALQIVYRELLAISLCWIVFASHSLKSGGFVRSFLSHSYWQPLSKMCLSIYHFHYTYETLTPVAFNDYWSKVGFHIYDTIVILFCSTILFLVVEAPAGKITDILLKFIDRKPTVNFEQLEIPIVDTTEKGMEKGKINDQ